VRYNLQFPNRANKFLETRLGNGRFSDFGVLAEEAGFDAVSVYDHPFPDDEWLRHGHITLDPFVSLTAVAERTQRIRLLTNVLVSGYRSPYVAAQAFATIDRFSQGRVIAGLAPGYLETEFTVLGAPYRGRGDRFDDAIAAMRAAWTGESVERDGVFPAHGHTMFPPAVQQPIPIWIGGNSERAMRRAAAVGDGWLPMSVAEEEAAVSRTDPLSTFEHLEERVARVAKMREEAGGAPLEICFAPFERHIRDWTEATASTAANLGRYADCGVTWMTIVASARSLDDLARDVTHFGETVIAPDRDR
jgi:probable F420-dependent oxidoreductase